MAEDKRPTFHKIGTDGIGYITYWDSKYNRWYHRVHPDRIAKRIIEQWRKEDFSRWRYLVSFKRLKMLGLF